MDSAYNEPEAVGSGSSCRITEVEIPEVLRSLLIHDDPFIETRKKELVLLLWDRVENRKLLANLLGFTYDKAIGIVKRAKEKAVISKLSSVVRF